MKQDSHAGMQDAVRTSVSFLDLKSPYLEIKDELDAAYHRFMETGWFVLGGETSSFEAEYAEFCEADHCVGLSNGLDALHLALRALGIGTGDEVIVPSNTYIATWLAVSQAGGVPVPVEPCPFTHNIDPILVSSAVTSRTRAILAVNLYGQPCDYGSLLEIARANRLKLVIDNAQAHGARYKGRRVGGIADIECHSFYPSKNLGAFGEAGAITTHDADLADRVRVLRNYGSRVRYHNEIQGWNSRIDELQAAFLRIKLRKLDEWNARRGQVAEMYFSQLSGLSADLQLATGVPLLPVVPEWASPVWHLFVIRHAQRDVLQRHLADQGVQTIIHYPIPPHLSGAYSGVPNSEAGRHVLPVAERLAGEVLSLPNGPHIPPDHVARVCAAVRSFNAHL